MQFQINTGRAFLELTKNPDEDHALMISVTGDAVSGTRETINMRLDAEKLRALYTGLDTTAPRGPQIPADLYTALQNALETAIVNAETLDDAAMEADDMEAQGAYHQETADLRELRDRLKVLTGKARNFDDHFTVVKDDNGDAVDFHPDNATAEHAERHLWTVLDCDGELCIVPGFAYVNRLQHIKTVEPWTDADTKEEWIY